MSKTSNYDAKVKAILDATHPGERVCALTGEKWMMDEREIGWYKKFNVPPSKYSPFTRIKAMAAYFILFDIWYNKHAETGKPIISNIHPATGIRVLPDEDWFGRDFSDLSLALDLQKPFFQQLYRLSRMVPRAAGYNPVKPERSIAFISFGDEDSYFVLACRSKRSVYCINGFDVEDSAELDAVNSARRSYNVIYSDRVYQCKFIRESRDVQFSSFLFDCRNCEYCFGATNQRNKKYLWFNEQLSREEWERRVAAVDLASFAVRQEYERKFHELVSKAIWPENFNINSPGCTGEYLTDCVDVKESYNARGARDAEYICYSIGPSHDLYYASGNADASDCYYGVGFHYTSQSKFSLSITQRCLGVEYCESCYDCSYCFGRVGLQRKSFCILNKQYTEAEYWKTVDALKCAMLDRGEYGEAAPAYFSTQHWPGSGATTIYEATEEDARRLRAAQFQASDDDAEGPPVDQTKIRNVESMPDRVANESIDSLVRVPFLDPKMGRRFSYLKPELELYQKLGVAPLRRHPTGCIHDLYREMNRPIFHETTCAKCGKGIRVADNQAYPKRIIYCQLCYLRYLEERG